MQVSQPANRKFSLTTRAAPLVLLVVAVLSYGLLIPWLGFYWDDWAKILVARLYGLGAYPAYYAGDRPLSSWTHMLFTPVLGVSPLAWQIFELLLIWLTAWGMFWFLDRLWPFARRRNLAAALIFLVYPVFIQQPAAVTFHQQYLQYALFFLSLGAMAQAACQSGARQRLPRRSLAWTALSMAAMLLQLSVTEYFVPLELVRLPVLWFLFAPSGGDPSAKRAARARILRTLRAWAPYLAVLAIFTAWRLFFIRLPGRDPYRAETLYAFLSSPFDTLVKLFQTVITDELHILVDSWAALLNFKIADAAPFTLLSYAVGLLAGIAAFAALMRSAGRLDADTAVEETDSRARLGQVFALGLVAVLLGPVPAWITGRQVVFDFHSDRYALPAVFGAALLFTAAIEWLAQRRLQRSVLAGILIALAVGLHLRAANDYRWIWTSEQRFFWQLSWRAPGLKAPTALFLENEPFPNQGLFSTSAALNLMYPQAHGWQPVAGVNQLSYWIYTLRPRFQQAPESFDLGVSTTFRTLSFQGTMTGSLLLYNDPARANCLWVLSSRDRGHPYLPELVRGFLPISDLTRILPESSPGYPPAGIIGPEPDHTWCYYFEKADLARQNGDWPAAARLATDAKAAGFTPTTPGANSPYEWLPMIEGVARTGHWSEAARLTRRASEADPHYNGMLCDLWTKNFADFASDSSVKPSIQDTQKFLGCKP